MCARLHFHRFAKLDICCPRSMTRWWYLCVSDITKQRTGEFSIQRRYVLWCKKALAMNGNILEYRYLETNFKKHGGKLFWYGKYGTEHTQQSCPENLERFKSSWPFSPSSFVPQFLNFCKSFSGFHLFLVDHILAIEPDSRSMYLNDLFFFFPSASLIFVLKGHINIAWKKASKNIQCEYIQNQEN